MNQEQSLSPRIPTNPPRLWSVNKVIILFAIGWLLPDCINQTSEATECLSMALSIGFLIAHKMNA